MNASIITTFRCNAHCHMCEIWKYPTKREEEFVPQILEKLPNNLNRINLTGGEPMIREDIEDIIKILRRKTKLIEISTNGYYTDRLIKIAEKYPKDIMIRVSIEGFPELNDSLRGIHNGFDHALRTMLALKKTRVKDIGFGIVICDKNAKDLIAVYDLCVALGVEFGNAAMHNSWYFHKFDNKINDIDFMLKQHRKFISSLLQSKRNKLRPRIKDWARAFFNKSIYRYLRGDIQFRPECIAGNDIFFIDPWGNVLPCNGTNEPMIMGNLNHQSWEDIWNGPSAIEIRKKVSNCDKTCVFIGTERFFMKRNPFVPIKWILKNKYYLYKKRDICID